MKRYLFTLCSLSLFGCEEEVVQETTVEICTDTATETSSDVVEEEVVEEIFLEEGIWAYSEVRVVEDRCGFSESFQEDLIESIEAVRYNINHVAEGNYIIALIIAEGLEVPTSCVSEGLVLDCEPISLNVPAYGTLLQETYTSFGTIDTSYRFEGQLLKEYACEGNECGAVEEGMNVTFPCSVDLDYTLNFFD